MRPEPLETIHLNFFENFQFKEIRTLEYLQKVAQNQVEKGKNQKNQEMNNGGVSKRYDEMAVGYH